MDISLALGGGGVRGVAHLGVIRELEKQGFKVKAIAGTSAGGLMGSAYAAGYSTEEIETAVNRFDQNHLFTGRRSDRPALLGLDSIANILSELLADRTFEDLPIPFAVTAVSLSTGKEIILREGKVMDAVLATIAIPGVFPSKVIGERVLVDGGVLDPVPIRLARWMRPDLPVAAVILHRKPEGYTFEDTDLPIQVPGPVSIVERLSKLRPVQAFNIFSRSIEVTGQHLTRLSVELYKPEVAIYPRVGHIAVLQNINTKDLIQAGIVATEEAVEELKSEANWMKRIQRSVRRRLMSEQTPEFWENISGDTPKKASE
ncbi:MAG: patatin-like phospholipase family protein [Chloroflexota bacterium]|nr:patatin-like phospholipase family protein [Chloroflexota bacterium]